MWSLEDVGSLGNVCTVDGDILVIDFVDQVDFSNIGRVYASLDSVSSFL